MTLGHVIIGRDEHCLDSCRDHEQAHVRQVERWGVAFIPAYLLASAWAWSRGRALLPGQLVRARRPPRLWGGLVTRAPRAHDDASDTAHVERHFTASESVRDVVIGMSDGLTVPFALAAGLSGAASVTTGIIVTAGLAEVAAGSIAMGLGGYLAARSDAEHYASEKHREEREVRTCPTSSEPRSPILFRDYGLTRGRDRADPRRLRGQPRRPGSIS